MAAEQTQAKPWVYVWELPVRLAHWNHVFAMLALAVSGYYIGAPFLTAPGDPAQHYIMGTMRLVHAVAAILVCLGLVVRFYWSIVGNPYAKITGLVPLTGNRLRGVWLNIKYYLFLSSRRPEYVGHNPLAGVTYVGLYVLVLAQAITGIGLYAEYYPQGFWWRTFGWAFRSVAQDNTLRLIHHSLMWVFIVFFAVHLYLAVLNDILERSSVNSSIVTGYKYSEGEAGSQAQAEAK